MTKHPNQLLDAHFTDKFTNLLETLLIERYSFYLSSNEKAVLKKLLNYAEEFNYHGAFSYQKAQRAWEFVKDYTEKFLEDTIRKLDDKIEEDEEEFRLETEALEREYRHLIKI